MDWHRSKCLDDLFYVLAKVSYRVISSEGGRRGRGKERKE